MPAGQETEDDEEFGDFAQARNAQSQQQSHAQISTRSSVIASSQPVCEPRLLSASIVSVPAPIPPPPPPSGFASITSTAVKHPKLTGNDTTALGEPFNGV